MFDLDELFRGFSNQDEYIARDMMILELLMKKGLITSEDIVEEFSADNLQAYIKIIQNQKKAEAQKRLDEYAGREKKDDTV
jgi:hypothetical protein|uniref:Uncharacterized protein n=1 Tax=Siphoviridae sp. ctsUY14 TaxID=2825693 RepID=A0A8S5P776_9CAUD|nr:MAG TPA: hypothetical protein [Siphoviridae sp. ctsUY14]